ncbi:MAG: class I SAM-dependent methyltransferase [Magnetococcales bacterium]|nr:class I SAM-dependent methyltransferase [Magnetococcales bacterium]MBF0148989.1 class I SAM-dependent methyltransferase [Magnetococcales bacterium]MBF0603055.1 class I SAM-dependent methyltransferase [Magnetococcales bacterium]
MHGTMPMTCPACDESADAGLRGLAEVWDVGLSFLRCDQCKALRLPPMRQIKASVETDIQKGDSRVMDALFQLRWRWLTAQLPMLRDRSVRILDMGCGDGQFLVFLRHQGYAKVMGLEPESARRANAVQRGVAVVAEMDELPAGRFDVIFLWHVLEHVNAPLAFLGALRTKLAPGGTIIVSIPNHGGWQTRLFGRYASFLDYGRHVWYWDSVLITVLRAHWRKDRVEFLRGRNFEYEIFGWVDTLAGGMTRSANFVHSRLKKNIPGVGGRMAALVLSGLLLPMAWILSLIVPPSQGGVLTFTLTPQEERISDRSGGSA